MGVGNRFYLSPIIHHLPKRRICSVLNVACRCSVLLGGVGVRFPKNEKAAGLFENDRLTVVASTAS
jgi:hypothetical protein